MTHKVAEVRQEKYLSVDYGGQTEYRSGIHLEVGTSSRRGPINSILKLETVSCSEWATVEKSEVEIKYYTRFE
jgi:hypothetical protein